MGNGCKRFWVMIFVVLVSSCGGGGSTSGGTGSVSGGTPPSIDPTTLSFTAIADGPIPATQSILVSSYSGEKLTVSSPAGAMPNWLTVTNNSGSSSPPFWVDIDIVTTNLAPGVYTATLRFNNVRTTPTTEVLGYQDVTVTYTVQSVLSVDQSALEFHVVNNTDTASTAQSVAIFGGDLNWSAAVSDSWLQISQSTGTAPGNLDINVAALGTNLVPDVYTGTVTLTAGGSQSQTITVTLYVEPQRLFVPDKAVALAKLPSRSKLTDTVAVETNGGGAVNWIATDDANWLVLNNTTGVSGGDLAVTADPTGLADGLYRATITVDPDNEPAIVNSQTIQVAFYVTSTDAASSGSISFGGNITAASATRADPLRPYLYASNGGSDIAIYNMYTTALENTVTVTGGQLADITISADGSTLYASNLADGSIAVVGLDTQTVTQTLTGNYFRDCASCATSTNYQRRIRYAEPNGYPVLVTSSLEFVDAGDGTVLDVITSRPATQFTRQIAFNAVGSDLFVAGNSSSMNEYRRYQLGYSYLASAGIYYEQTHLTEYLGNIVGFEVTPDGVHLCSAIDTQNSLTCLNTTDLSSWLSLSLSGSAAGVAVDDVGNIYGGFSSYPDLTADDVEHFDATGVLQVDTYNAGQYIDSGQITVSGDGLRLVVRGGTTTTTSLFFYDTTF